MVVLLAGVGNTSVGEPSRGRKSGSRRLESVGVGNGATLGGVAPQDTGVKPGRSWLRPDDGENLPGDGSSEPEASGEGACCIGIIEVDVGRSSSIKVVVKSK